MHERNLGQWDLELFALGLKRMGMKLAWYVGIAVAICSIPPRTTADESIELARGSELERPQQPQIAVDEHGGIHLVYGVGNSIRYRRSDDGGTTFADAVSLPAMNNLALGMRRGPRIAVVDGVIVVTAVAGKQGKGRDGDVLALRSTDRGATWEGPSIVNDVADSAREGLHGLAAGPGGRFYCVWLDLRTQKTEIMASISLDHGATWQKNVLVYRSPDGSVCECCHPSVCFDSAGNIFVMWRNSLNGARDMYLAKSDDGGLSFSDAAKLGDDTWPLDACPMDGGAIVAIAPDEVASAWRRIDAVYLLAATGQRITELGQGEQPWIAATKEGPYIIWLQRGQVVLYPPGESKMIALAQRGRDPVIASDPTGRGPVVAAWESHDDDDYTIQCQVVAPRK